MVGDVELLICLDGNTPLDHVGRLIVGLRPRLPVPSSVTVIVQWNADEAEDADERRIALPVVDGPRGLRRPSVLVREFRLVRVHA